MDIATNLLLDMRLKIEGAVEVYECDGLPLRRLAIENDMPVPASAYDTIGSALYDLREHIRDLCRLSRPTVYKYLKLLG